MLAMHHQSKELALALKLGDLALGNGPGVEHSFLPRPVPSGAGDSWTKQVPNTLTPPRFRRYMLILVIAGSCRQLFINVLNVLQCSLDIECVDFLMVCHSSHSCQEMFHQLEQLQQ
jgi:hypothetical protein